MATGKNAIALLLGKPSKEDTEEEAPSSEKGEADRGRDYFDEFTAALRDKDDDGAFEALRSFVSHCTDKDD